MTTRNIILIPHKFKNLCYKHNQNKIPTQTIEEQPDGDFYILVDRKCPCDCENKYQTARLHKEDIDDYINNQTNKNREENARWFLLFDSECK